MNQELITIAERQDIQKHFGMSLEEMTLDSFKKIRNELRAKYHPDKFEKHEDETIREMATEKFQLIQSLSEKIAFYLENKFKNEISPEISMPFLDQRAQFSFDEMKIEIMTADQDLKYHLFGKNLRWLLNGEKYKIPHTQAFIIIDEDYLGVRPGFKEAIKLYLSFGVEDSLEKIVEWLYQNIVGRADSLIIEKNLVKIDLKDMLLHIKRKSFKQLSSQH
ncbi:MAG: hypothetical protein MUE85_24270 [Microscillaceae bacterium]|jgi:hypothetical protein|nr:hypothetical protein [Microscillaceae bacterium]